MVGGIVMARYFRISDLRNGRSIRWDVVDAPVGSQVLFCEIENRVGMKLCPINNIPYALEVDGWGELACVGETYETDDFEVEAISYEEYYDTIKC